MTFTPLQLGCAPGIVTIAPTHIACFHVVQWCRLLHMLPNVHAGSWCKSAILTLLCTRPAISQPIVLQDDRSVNADRSLSRYACTAGHSSSALSLQSVSHCMRESDSDSKSCCVSILNTVGCGTIGCCANGWSRLRHLAKQVWYQHSFDNHCELSLAITRYGMLQSNFMPCTEHATAIAMTILFVCALVCTSLLYDIKSCQDSEVVLPLKPSVSNICHVCFATTYYPTLQTSWTSNVTECSIAQSSSKCKHK